MNHLWKTIGLAGALSLTALCLTACMRREPQSGAVVQETEAPATAAPAVVVPEATDAPSDGGADARRAEERQAYQAALRALMETHVMPDGADCGYDAGMDAAGNQFAVYDVDLDGSDELIILYTTTFTGGQTAGVYAYDGGRLRPELSEYPLLTFYANGAIRADWSHNQGLAGRFWPYTLYRYDAETDSYQNAGMVDAWDKSFAGTGVNGTPFPDDVDASGTGLVYYIMTHGEYEEVAPVDASEYEAWRASCVGDGAEAQIPFMTLTEENIAACGD